MLKSLPVIVAYGRRGWCGAGSVCRLFRFPTQGLKGFVCYDFWDGRWFGCADGWRYGGCVWVLPWSRVGLGTGGLNLKSKDEKGS